MNMLEVIESKEILGVTLQVYGTFEEPLFLAKDVAEWIEYNADERGAYNVAQMLETLDEEEKIKTYCTLSGVSTTHTPVKSMVGATNRWFITEDGLYELLMQSTKPIAKQFKKEVKSILKEIRQKGYHIDKCMLRDEVIEDLLFSTAKKKIELEDKLKIAKQVHKDDKDVIKVLTAQNKHIDEYTKENISLLNEISTLTEANRKLTEELHYAKASLEVMQEGVLLESDDTSIEELTATNTRLQEELNYVKEVLDLKSEDAVEAEISQLKADNEKLTTKNTDLIAVCEILGNQVIDLLKNR